MANTLTAAFPDRASAEHALAILSSSGFNAHIASSPNRDQGGVLVSVDAQDNAAEAQQALLNAGASRIDPPDAHDREMDGTIGGIAPAAVTDAAPPQQTSDGAIGGIAPAAVTSAESAAHAAGSRALDVLQPRQASSAPADDTFVSPDTEMPYTERQAQFGDTSERHPITDDDIIANAQHEHERDQSADLDVPPPPQTSRAHFPTPSDSTTSTDHNAQTPRHAIN